MSISSSMNSSSLNPPRATEFHYRWAWDFQSSPEALWPLVADTNRFNRDTGVPAVAQRNAADDFIQNARRRLRLYRFGIPVEWEEEPFEWVRPFRYGVVRHYSSGPVLEMRVLVELTPKPEGGTHLVYEVWASPRNLLGLVAIPAQIGFLSARAFSQTLRQYDQIVRKGVMPIMLPGKVQYAPGGHARLLALRDRMIRDGGDAEIIGRLVETLETADELALARMRPYELAESWGLPRRATLEHFLLATRLGMLELHWDVLCPMCRNPKQSGKTLSDLGNELHCDVCHIDFTTNFDRSVELTFHPNPAIREAEAGEFCIAGPQTTPHVVIQQLLQPGEERLVNPSLEVGRYRLRTLGLPGNEFIQVTEDGLRDVRLRASRLDGWPDGELQIAPTPMLRLKNATDEEQLFIFERQAWGDTAVTAAEVTAMQVFRDLFASEALRPGEQISVGSLTIIFTDLRGSTRLYNEIGDAPAFGLVMNHFDVLRDAIQDEGGAIVKTIGDAVMAVFRRPAPAIRAMLLAQKRLSEMNEPLHLKAGIHYGPCIAVTLNDRLDYFGSTVNKAARLEGLSSGGDVVISGTVESDPEVAALLEDGTFRAEMFNARLKGFDAEEFMLWRVALASNEVRVLR
ncbi:MAG: DUF5939 domain-containing protein [Anaerolineae bacterium]|nr:DUF5939 domain-containing protein [Anaerolineae bacterium]